MKNPNPEPTPPADQKLVIHRELVKGAKRLIDSVEFDVNGTHGKGGNGGLTSDQTIRAAGELRVILSRLAATGEEEGFYCDEIPAPATKPIGFVSEYGLKTLASKVHHYSLSISKSPENEFQHPVYADPAPGQRAVV